MRTSSIHYYTVYLRKNDELVASGTVAECAERMIEKIMVCDDHFVVEFKPGIEITINE